MTGTGYEGIGSLCELVMAPNHNKTSTYDKDTRVLRVLDLQPSNFVLKDKLNPDRQLTRRSSVEFT